MWYQFPLKLEFETREDRRQVNSHRKKTHISVTAAVAQSVRVLVQQAVGWVFESQSRHTLVVKTGSDSSTAKQSAIDVSRVPGDDHYKRMSLVTEGVAS